jgi:hypothetical protein
MCDQLHFPVDDSHVFFAADGASIGEGRMGSVWTFLRGPANQRLLSWLGGGAVVFAGGIWAVVTWVWPAHEAPTAVCADQGIAIGGNVSRSKINNKVSGGAATVGPCVTSPKK